MTHHIMHRVYVMTDFARRHDRAYAQRRSADRYAAQHGLTVVDSWPLHDPPPTDPTDARAWDDWRLRRGVAGR